MPHFHLFDNIKNTSMNNCSIYIRWKTKFAVLTVWKYLKNNFSVDWKRVNSILSHIDKSIDLAYIHITQWVQGKIRVTMARTLFFLNLLLKLKKKKKINKRRIFKFTTIPWLYLCYAEIFLLTFIIFIYFQPGSLLLFMFWY